MKNMETSNEDIAWATFLAHSRYFPNILACLIKRILSLEILIPLKWKVPYSATQLTFSSSIDHYCPSIFLFLCKCQEEGRKKKPKPTNWKKKKKKKPDEEVRRGCQLQAQTLQTPRSICTQYSCFSFFPQLKAASRRQRRKQKGQTNPWTYLLYSPSVNFSERNLNSSSWLWFFSLFSFSSHTEAKQLVFRGSIYCSSIPSKMRPGDYAKSKPRTQRRLEKGA